LNRGFERVLIRSASVSRKGILFFAGYLVGIFGNALTDDSIRNVGDLASRLFDARGRPVVLANWLVVLVTLFLLLSPALLRWSGRGVQRRLRAVDVLRQSRPEFLSNQLALAVDGAVTLAQCPDFHVGWRLSEKDVVFRHTDERWSPPSARAAHRKAFASRFERDGRYDSTQIRLLNSPAPFTDAPQLRLETGSVRFSDVQFFRDEMLRPESIPGRVNEAVDSRRIDFPAGMTAQVLVVTSDAKVLLTQRSMKVFWFPGRWSASIEENMTLEDIQTGGNSAQALRALLVRALREELGLAEGDDYDADDGRILSVFLETADQVLATHLCMAVRLGISRDDLDARIQLSDRPDHEFRRWTFASYRQCVPYLAAKPSPWFHPTSRYRLLMLLLHVWGAERTATALEHVEGEQGLDPLGLGQVGQGPGEDADAATSADATQ
jgi:isopentenyldiphosphate isomerase